MINLLGKQVKPFQGSRLENVQGKYGKCLLNQEIAKTK